MSYLKAAYGAQRFWQEKTLDTAWQRPDLSTTTKRKQNQKTEVACLIHLYFIPRQKKKSELLLCIIFRMKKELTGYKTESRKILQTPLTEDNKEVCNARATSLFLWEV